MTIEVLRHPTQDDWREVLRRCLITVGKKSAKIPDMNWRIKMLRCRHSPIRYLQFSFFLRDIPYWLSTELCRHHIGIEKFVRSQRDDRAANDIPRAEKPQGALVDMIVDINADALMTIFAKRSCGCATKEMQLLMLLIKSNVTRTNPEFSGFLTPPCEQTGRCNEFSSCGKKALYFGETT